MEITFFNYEKEMLSPGNGPHTHVCDAPYPGRHVRLMVPRTRGTEVLLGYQWV